MHKNKNPLIESLQTLLWANSVALTWAWGLGLFFAVQIAIQFGMQALVQFATIDALGLIIFGLVNQKIVDQYSSAEEFEAGFLSKAKDFKFALLLFQFLAITLTLYCCLKYVSMPLGILSILVCIMFFGAVIFLGEEFSINRIKYSHGVYAVVIMVALAYLLNSELFTSGTVISAALSKGASGVTAQLSLNSDHLSWLEQAWAYTPLYTFSSKLALYAFWIPVVLGFLCGPWLDIQNWQRVVQINKEGRSVAVSYIIGGLIFWAILIADGAIALACYQKSTPEILATLSNIDPSSLLYSVKSTITQVLSSQPQFQSLLGFYMIFIAFAALATFDSGYIAYKWYSESIIKESKSIIFSLVPSKLLSSPIPWFALCAIVATLTLHFSELGKFIAIFDAKLQKFFRFELEYYAAFFASFLLIYAVCFYRSMKCYGVDKQFSALKLLATALSGVAVFGIGYFSENTIMMAFGSLLPFVYGWFTVSQDAEITASDSEPKLVSNQATTVDLGEFKAETINPVEISELPLGAKSVGIKGCYMKDGWFVHHFIPTYQDTNSVGNVYFAMYLMWVGKTRELFFMHTMPDFDPKTSDYLILTRSIDHKFVREIQEFDEVTIEIRIADYNRKFVTLEHRIREANGELVGKGKQTLMFVDSKNYGLLDLPAEVQKTYVGFVDEVKGFVEVDS